MTTMTRGAGKPAWQRPWRLRLQAGLGALARAWSVHRARRRCDADFLDLAHLSDRMLRDIGVPQRLCDRGPGAPHRALERPRW